MATKTAHTLSLDAANGANDCTTEIQKFLAGAVLALGLRAQIDGVQPWAGATHADERSKLQAELVGLLTPPPDPTPAPIAESQPDVAEQPQEG